MITTFQQHISLKQQEITSEDSAALLKLMSGITLAAKMIEAKIRRASLSGLVGEDGGVNSHGESQQKLDIYANDALIHCLGMHDAAAVLISEENNEPIISDKATETSKYAIFFDPLDGSSNIDVNVNVGTIFSIYRIDQSVEEIVGRLTLHPGICQVAAGYVLYGPSTVLAYTSGNGVHLFTLDPTIGSFVLSGENLKMPNRGRYYSCNEANIDEFPAHYEAYLSRLRTSDPGESYSSRYVGSLVADFHRTLLRGGIFLYPPTTAHPEGKLRLLYEASPLAFIAEQAGGMAINGEQSILRIQPTSVHQRTPLVIGGCSEVELFLVHASQPA
ncbi:MAG: fructose-bisphosphatase [Acidobacteriales bacterium 59-55]|nr:class 1 fructose-bisphosphatase [Terriglobales bacterium]OJV40271.1 MAG: fructose-bisphosphatase [Acidobacteriales bacterium 59-55]